MYDGKSQLLIKNPDQPATSLQLADGAGMKKNADGSLTLHIQKDSPGKAKESNWVAAPDGPIYLVMRPLLAENGGTNRFCRPAKERGATGE